MSRKKTFLILFLTLLSCYSSDFLPFITSKLSKTGKLVFVGSIEPYSSTCAKKTTAAICGKKYIIPLRDIIVDDLINPEFGIGFFLSTLEAKCTNYVQTEAIDESISEISSKAVLESYKIYKTINLKNLKCRKNDLLIIEAWNKYGLNTFGQISRNAVAGESESVFLIKRTAEFQATSIYFLWCLILFFIIFINRYLQSKFKLEIYETDVERYFEPFLIFWSFFALFKSGFIEIFFPAVSDSLVLFRLQTLFSFLAHVGPIFYFLLYKILGKYKNAKYFPLLIILPFFFTKYFNISFVYISFIFSVLLILLGSKTKANQFLFVYAGLVLLEDTKTFSSMSLPYGSTTLTYVSLLNLFDSIKRMYRMSQSADVMLWNYSISQEGESAYDSIARFSKKFNIRRISLLQLIGSNNKISTLTFENGNKLVDEKIIESSPSVFAHVLSTGKAIVHADTDNEQIRHILKRQPLESFGKYFSIFPIVEHGKIHGAISFTGYNVIDLVADDDSFNFKISLDVLLKNIIREFYSREHEEKSAWNFKCKMIDDDLKIESNQYNNFDEMMKNIMVHIEEKLGLEGFYANLEELTSLLKISAITISNAEAREFMLKTEWHMAKENLHGPGTIAINKQQIVSIGDVRWVKDVVSINTFSYFNLSNTKSLAVLPIMSREESGNKVYGILWLQSKELGYFDVFKEEGLLSLQSTIENHLKIASSNSIISKMTNDILRDDVKEKVLQGHLVEEVETGFLILIDLKKSTKIESQLGAENWSKLINDIIVTSKRLANKYDFKLEMRIWDAFFFTATFDDSKSDDAVKKILHFGAELNAELFNVYSNYPIDNLFESKTSFIRVCVDYGQLDKKIVSGSWTVVGGAMPSVCKIEQSVKLNDGFLFLSEDFASQVDSQFKPTGAVHPVTGKEILGLSIHSLN